jgi:hypothetical protein
MLENSNVEEKMKQNKYEKPILVSLTDKDAVRGILCNPGTGEVGH